MDARVIVSAYPVVEPDDFARRFSMRSGKLMWLLRESFGARRKRMTGLGTAPYQFSFFM